MAELYRRAQARLSAAGKGKQAAGRAGKRKTGTRKAVGGRRKAEAEAVRVLHELEVHQIELEMQNAELQKVRYELEGALEKYTDLYDFAPVGYCSLDESGLILEANLTGADMLGVERSRLIKRRLLPFLSAVSRPAYLRDPGATDAEPTGQRDQPVPAPAPG